MGSDLRESKEIILSWQIQDKQTEKKLKDKQDKQTTECGLNKLQFSIQMIICAIIYGPLIA